MIIYLVKSSLCMLLMLAIYLLLLEKEKIYRFNRFYLLFSLAFSLTVPLLHLKIDAPAPAAVIAKAPRIVSGYLNRVNQDLVAPVRSRSTINNVVSPATGPRIPWESVVLLVYVAATLGFLFRFARNIRRIVSGISRHEIIRFHDAKLVLLKEEMVTHTFLKYIFINERQYKNKLVEKEVLAHELAHANQKHTLDILFIELLQVILWFNPILPFYNRAIQLNHEFLADDAVVKKYHNHKTYLVLLLDTISAVGTRRLSSGFSYQVTRKRLTMLTSATTSRRRSLLKALVVIPVVLVALFLFATAGLAKTAPYSKIKKIIHSRLPSVERTLSRVTLPSEPPEVRSVADTTKKISAEIDPFKTDSLPSQFYRRVPMSGENGKRYDRIYLDHPDAGQMDMAFINKEGKAAFLIGSQSLGYKVYDESQLPLIDSLLRRLPLAGGMGNTGRNPSRFPGLDLSAYDAVFYFNVSSFEPDPNPKRRFIPLYSVQSSTGEKEMSYGSIKPGQIIEATVDDYFKSRPAFPASYSITRDGDNKYARSMMSNHFILSTLGKEETAALAANLKPGDKISILIKYRAMDDITPNAIIYPEAIKKGDRIIYRFKAEMVKELDKIR